MSSPTTDFFDERETQSADAREAGLFGQLAGLLHSAQTQSSGWAEHLADIDPSLITDRDALATLPVMRKSDLMAQQQKSGALGGLNITELGSMRHLFMSPGPVFEPAGRGQDWWNAVRALYAAGFRKGDIVHNSFSYHLTPAGMMFESGAEKIGCAVIPAGVGQTEQQVEVAHAYGANAFAGIPDFLNVLLEKSQAMNLPLSFTKAMVSGAALFPQMREKFEGLGIQTFQCYGTADLGIIAYETNAKDGMVLSEDIILEIVVPGTSRPAAQGEVGEIVITRLNKDYPLFRFGTGDMTMVLSEPSPCGRTNTRIKGWMGRADQRTKVKGMFVDPAQVDLIKNRLPEVGRVRLVVTRDGDRDLMTLVAETDEGNETLKNALTQQLRDVTKLGGSVEFVAVGSLANDGVLIEDQRPIEAG